MIKEFVYSTLIVLLLAFPHTASAANPSVAATDMLEIPIDQNGNGSYDYLSLAPKISGSSGEKVIVRAILRSGGGPALTANDTPVTLHSTSQPVHFDFSGPLIRQLRMTGPFTLDLQFYNPEIPGQAFKTMTLRLKRSYDYRTFDTFTR